MGKTNSNELPSSSQDTADTILVSTQKALGALNMQIASVSMEEIRDHVKPYQVGKASFYGPPNFTKKNTMSNGEKFDPDALTAAHRDLPFGTQLLVLADPPQKGKAPFVIVTVKDRGPFYDKANRILDLSKGAFEKIADTNLGVVKIKIYEIPKGKGLQDLIASQT